MQSHLLPGIFQPCGLIPVLVVEAVDAAGAVDEDTDIT
jgi:hypothetical protein